METGRNVLDAIVTNIVDPIVLLLFAAGVFLFTWGLAAFMFNMNNLEERKRGVQHMLWGIIGVFIMATVFGIINIITGTFGIDDPQSPGSGEVRDRFR